MRISSSLMYQIALGQFSRKEAQQVQLFEQISTGLRVVRPGDDPLAAAQAVRTSQNLELNERFAANRQVAKHNMGETSQMLDATVNTLQDVTTRLVEVGNGIYSETDQRALAKVLKESYDRLLNQANARDGNGVYMFSGHRGDVAPFQTDSDGWVSGAYQGDEGKRLIQIDQTRQMPTAESAVNIFARANPGDRSYAASSAPGNQGTATFSSPAVTSQDGEHVGKMLRIAFEADPAAGGVRYVVTDANQTVLDSGPYDAETGLNLSVGGLSLAIQGQPAEGDSFTLEPMAQADMDVFSTLRRTIDALESLDKNDPVSVANFRNVVGEAQRKLGSVYDNVLTVQASLGARMNELSALDTVGSARGLSYAKQLDNLVGLNEFAAYSQQIYYQNALEASMLAFQRIQSLGLFNGNN
ncbi:flagellar hook-associated protein FlgL [Kerstersia gyiorum]|uniref:flagellar hook-associated protein FlgL n=1 Tax=Kerstersia gyiorum TaxID=206506 RepID=UPI00209F8262|nr:flagellar hook-associated protein FlgL [Kerstersia gyiorum]MCP1633280.1 flagellar hook-associated protein 3 FlgL [Kerstersia gyiorum]MCP1636151.1 flagellar hook-associated protein 3 FlgL [Kerstersia gyiorum]MCP1671282.1 flagellar hook-associated protein 3 FlgL [Kerstersia gyiorum]MCP1679063.1 flagellar hook-associated protein 3 FlgL [Kerstersia gyiorum]MCP1681863.1 flagellar hook-associated protein 3 FlgL [Kerstersia gyiorum]